MATTLAAVVVVVVVIVVNSIQTPDQAVGLRDMLAVTVVVVSRPIHIYIFTICSGQRPFLYASVCNLACVRSFVRPSVRVRPLAVDRLTERLPRCSVSLCDVVSIIKVEVMFVCCCDRCLSGWVCICVPPAMPFIFILLSADSCCCYCRSYRLLQHCC